jgi:hypothetical protein
VLPVRRGVDDVAGCDLATLIEEWLAAGTEWTGGRDGDEAADARHAGSLVGESPGDVRVDGAVGERGGPDGLKVPHGPQITLIGGLQVLEDEVVHRILADKGGNLLMASEDLVPELFDGRCGHRGLLWRTEARFSRPSGARG